MEKKYIEDLWEKKTPNTYLETFLTIFAICIFIGAVIFGIVSWFVLGNMFVAFLCFLSGFTSLLFFFALAAIIRLLRQIRDNTKKRF